MNSGALYCYIVQSNTNKIQILQYYYKSCSILCLKSYLEVLSTLLKIQTISEVATSTYNVSTRFPSNL